MASTNRTKAYSIWKVLQHKCYNTNYHNYRWYGARGIKVCERWHTFENYYCDMGDAPPGLTLERVDNDGDYSPDNCVWATRTEQCRNRRSNRLLTLNGRTQCVAEWAEEIGVKTTTIRQRIDYYGWSVEKALTTGVDLG